MQIYNSGKNSTNQERFEKFFLRLFDSKADKKDLKLTVYFKGKCSIGYNALFNFVELRKMRYPRFLLFIFYKCCDACL